MGARAAARAPFGVILVVFILLALAVPPASAEMAFERAWGPTPDGTFRTAHAIAVDAAGTAYVADDTGRVQVFDSSGAFLRKWGTRGYATGQLAVPYVADLTVDASGNVYTVEPNGARVQKFDPSGTHLQTFGSGAGTGDGQFQLPMGAAVDASGNVYVVESYNHRVQKFDASGAPVAKWGTPGSAPGQFSSPDGIAVAPDGSVYVSDTANSRIQKFDPDGTFRAEFGLGFARPQSIEIDAAGTIYVQTAAYSIQKLSGAGLPLGTIGRQGTADGEFTGVLRDHAVAGGHVYTIDADRVQRLTDAGSYVTRWGRPAGSADGELRSLTAIAASAAGRVYVADSEMTRIHEFDADGAFVRKWGSAGTGDGQLSYMVGLAVGAGGDVYVAANNRVQQFTATGAHVRSWGGLGTAEGQFSGLCALAVDAAGNVYTLEQGARRVQKFTSSGAFVRSFAWSPGTGPNEFPRPTSIAVGSDGNVYVGHGGNRFKIDRFAADGTPLGQLNAPNVDAMTADSRQHLFRLDILGGVQRQHLEGVAFERFGTPRGSEDGRFQFARALAASGRSLYVADAGTWRVQKFTENDTTAPETAVTSGPSGHANAAGASLGFTSTDTLSRFVCRIDEGPWEGCGSSSLAAGSGFKTYANLAEGQHTFEVRASDEAENEDPTPASRTFTLDRTAPDTTIDAGPSGPTNASSVDFAFSSDEASSFECRLDRGGVAGSWAACTSAKQYAGLGDGSYTFSVRAKDQAANVDASPATRSFTVDRSAPETTVGSGPSGPTNADPVVFGFGSADASAVFECRLDAGTTAGAWEPCVSAKSYAGLGDGSYTFSVRAKDQAANVDASPATRSFTVDRSAPETTVESGPSGPTNADPVVFGFGSPEAGARFECRLTTGSVPGPWTECTTARSYDTLDDGSYVFAVRAKDALDNADPSPATRSFSVDRTAPETTLDSGPSGTVTSSTAAFTFSSPESASRFECRLDGGAWAACSSGIAYDGLSAAAHVVDVRAVDALGNADPTPASRTWTVAAPASSGPGGSSESPGPSVSPDPAGVEPSRGAEHSGHDVGLLLAGKTARGGRTVRLGIACGAACPALSVSASVKIAGGRKALRVGGARVAAGARFVTLKLSKRTRDAIKRAIKRKRRVTLTVRVKGLRPGGGVLWTKRKTLTLKRL